MYTQKLLGISIILEYPSFTQAFTQVLAVAGEIGERFTQQVFRREKEAATRDVAEKPWWDLLLLSHELFNFKQMQQKGFFFN